MRKLLIGCALIAAGLQGSLTANMYGMRGSGDNRHTAGFEGLYVGGNIGVFSHTAHLEDLNGFGTGAVAPFAPSSVDTSFTAGVQLGYDWRCNYSLFGLVVDWNWVDTDHSRTYTFTGIPGRVKADLDWFTTIRARAGLTVCDALVYVTGGAAVTRREATWTSTASANAGQLSTDNTQWGWTGGVGAEFMVWCNFGLQADFLYMHFSRDSYSRTLGGTTYNFAHSDSAWVGRIGLNYHFGDLCCWW